MTSFTLFQKPQESGKEAGNGQACAYFFLLGISINFLEVRQTAVYIPAPTALRRQRWIEVGTGQMHTLLLTPSPSSYRTIRYADGRQCSGVLSRPERAVTEREVKQPGRGSPQCIPRLPPALLPPRRRTRRPRALPHAHANVRDCRVTRAAAGHDLDH